MPPQNTIELTSKNQQQNNGTTAPTHTNHNNNNTTTDKQVVLQERFTKTRVLEEPIQPATTSIIVPPDGGFGWIVMIASFFNNVIVDGIIFSAGMFIDPIQAELGGSKATVALATSLLSGFYLIAGPFVSALANRYGFQKVTVLGGIIAASSFALSYFATSVTYLHFIYGVLGGVGMCCIYISSVIIVGYYFEKWRPLAVGIALAGSGVGTFIFAPMTAMMITNFGWRFTLLIQACILLSCSLFGMAFRPIEPTQVVVDEEDETLMGKPRLPVVYTKPLPEGRFAYSVPNSVQNTWMGANNTSYPTAAEVFKGSGNMDRRPSQTSGVLTQNNIISTSKKLEQFKQAQKRSGYHTPTTPDALPDHPPPTFHTAPHHELTAVGEAEEENENGTLLEKEPHPIILQGRRHTVSGKRPSEPNSRVGSRRGTITDANRPLYRDDIFYSGSLVRVPQYQSQSSVAYHMSVTHLPTKHDIEEEAEASSKCKICPEAVRRTLATMLDVSLLKSPSFLLLAFSGFFTMMGFFVPFVYITQRATAGGMDGEVALYIISAIGITNTIARVVCGLMSSLNINALHLNNVAITIGGIATIFSGYSISAGWQFGYAAIFGIAIACFSALRSILVVDLMGLEKLTNAFGILMLFQGVAAIFGTPLAGWIYEETKSYDVSFWVAGALITFSAVLCYPLAYVNNKEKLKAKQALENPPPKA